MTEKLTTRSGVPIEEIKKRYSDLVPGPLPVVSARKESDAKKEAISRKIARSAWNTRQELVRERGVKLGWVTNKAPGHS